MRALRSPASSERASVFKVWRKLSLSPRTPTRAATPTATERTTKPNFPGADLRSRQPMAAARFQLNARLAIFLPVIFPVFDEGIFDHETVFKHNFAIGTAGNFGIVRDQHQRGSGLAIPVQKQIENHLSVH